MTNVLTVFGTRPEAIKMAPVIQVLRDRRSVRSIVCATGQHDQMLRQVLDIFSIQPAVDLGVMRPNQTLAALTATLVDRLDSVVVNCVPDWVLAQGDTTTVLAAALVSHYRGVPFGHVEAGLRTFNKFQPFPEEMNRRLADCLSDLYFAPTARAADNLRAEGIDPARIVVTGNTVVDALLQVSRAPYDWTTGPLAAVPRERKIVLVTAHRRESFGRGLQQICAALKALALEFSSHGYQFVFPVHLNPNVQEPVKAALRDVMGVTLLSPLDYLSLVQILKRAVLVLTDSGGLQEEAPTFGLPVLVMRETTERPEGVEAGIARLVGTESKAIIEGARPLLSDPSERTRMASVENPYGDGRAAQRIVDRLLSGV